MRAKACTCTHLEFRHKRSKGGHGSKRGECLECVKCEEFKPQEDSEDTELLTRLVEMAFAEIREDLKTTKGDVKPFLAFYSEGRSLARLPVPAAMMDSGEAKDRIFGFMRDMARKRTDIDAVIIATDMWQGVPTPKLLALKEDEMKRLLANNNVYELEKLGYCKRRECVGVIVQTPRRVMHLFQHYKRTRSGAFDHLEEVCRYETGQETFMGSTKMFGEEVPEFYKDVIETE